VALLSAGEGTRRESPTQPKWQDGTLTYNDTVLYNKPNEVHSLLIFDLPPAPPYSLQLESLAGVSTFGVTMVAGDPGDRSGRRRL